jgi:TatA/E family protein of Tat protein translocase
MGPLGVPELIFILVIALLIFGPKRLPEFGRTIGKALGEFRRASNDLKRSIDVELSAADDKRPTTASAPAPTSAVSRATDEKVEDEAEDTGDEAGPADAEEAAEKSADEEPEEELTN